MSARETQTAPAPAPRVKFCGLSQLGDVPAVNEVHPDYVGFVFWPQSKRAVSAEEARALREALNADIATVGVFVDEDATAIAQLHKQGTISIAQLHGNEDEVFIDTLRQQAPALEVWKAFEVRTPEDVQRANESTADLVLLDAGKGEGQAFDWSLLCALRRPFALAGGLNPDTIAQALAALPEGISPLIVDVSTGIEGAITDAAGRPSKDPQKMQQFRVNLERNR